MRWDAYVQLKSLATQHWINRWQNPTWLLPHADTCSNLITQLFVNALKVGWETKPSYWRQQTTKRSNCNSSPNTDVGKLRRSPFKVVSTQTAGILYIRRFMYFWIQRIEQVAFRRSRLLGNSPQTGYRIAMVPKATIRFATSVRPSARNNSPPAGRLFVTFHMGL